MSGMRPRWLLGAAMLAVVAGIWVGFLVFDALARG
jgi:hypothetical protein